MAEAAVLAAVGWVVSPLIRKLADKPPSYFGGDVSTDKLHELKTITLPKIETVIEAAGTIPIGRLEPWLNDLKAAALEAEDVLDEYDYKLLREKVSPLSSASLFSVAESSKKTASKAKGCLSPLLPKTKLAKSVEKLEKTAARVDEFIEVLKLKINPDLADSSTSAASVVANTQEVIATTSIPPLAVVGRDGECDHIVYLLTSSAADALESSGSGSKVPVIAIHGIGGAGKTTLAQKIYSDPRVVQYFQCNRIWVHVPRKFDPSRVAKEMMESLTGEPTVDMLNLDALLNKLKENLKDKKFLLVLDDVWNEPKDKMQSRWDQPVGALNAVAARGSRILMMTRMEGVALMLGAKACISLEELKSEDCLSIIEHYAFHGGLTFADFPEELREVGKQIVNRLKGSPIAARVVASNQLRRKWTVDAWRRILEGDLLNTSTVRDVLLSSFKHLPLHQNWERAGAVYIKLANCHLKLDSKHEAASAYVDAANCYKKYSTQDAAQCLEQAVNLFLEIGRLNMAARYCKELGEIYEQGENLEKSMEYYERAADLFQSEEVTTSANQCKQKIAQFSAQLEQYPKAIEIFEEIARHSMNSNLLKYSVKGILLNAGICQICRGDVVAITNSLERYQDLDPTFSGTREHRLLADLATAMDEEDVGKFTDAIKEFDNMTRLDPWKTTLLLRAKNALKAREEEEDDLT